MSSKKNKRGLANPPSVPARPFAPKPQQNIIEATSSVQQIQQFAGPLPHPDVLRGYEAAHQGLAERIVKMAEAQAAHRQEIEKRAVDAQISEAGRMRDERKRGQVFGLVAVLASLVIGGAVAWHGQQWAGGGIGSIGLTGLVVAFIVGRKEDAAPPTARDERRETLPAKKA